MSTRAHHVWRTAIVVTLTVCTAVTSHGHDVHNHVLSSIPSRVARNEDLIVVEHRREALNDTQNDTLNDDGTPDCNGHGTLDSTSCTCDIGYFGSFCQFSQCGEGIPQPDGSCECNTNQSLWTGLSCECALLAQDNTECAACRADYAGPNCSYHSYTDCNERGSLRYGGSINDNDSCRCDEGALGSNCQYTDETTCNGHGKAFVNGSCLCLPGFKPPLCDELDCGPSGSAVAMNDSQTCDCLGLWNGPKCECFGNLGECVTCRPGYAPRVAANISRGATINVCVPNKCESNFFGHNCECYSPFADPNRCTSCSPGFVLFNDGCQFVSAEIYYDSILRPRPVITTTTSGLTADMQKNDDGIDEDEVRLAAMIAVVLTLFILLLLIVYIHFGITSPSDYYRTFDAWWLPYIIVAVGATCQFCGWMYASFGGNETSAQNAAIAFCILVNLIPAIYFVGAGYGLTSMDLGRTRLTWARSLFWEFMLFTPEFDFRGPNWLMYICAALLGLPFIINCAIAGLIGSMVILVVPLEVVYFICEQAAVSANVIIQAVWSYFSEQWIPVFQCGCEGKTKEHGPQAWLAGPGYLIVGVSMIIVSVTCITWYLALLFMILPVLFSVLAMSRVFMVWPRVWNEFLRFTSSAVKDMRIPTQGESTFSPESISKKGHDLVLTNCFFPATASKKKSDCRSNVFDDYSFLLAVSAVFQIIFHTFPMLIISASGPQSGLAEVTWILSAMFLIMFLATVIIRYQWNMGLLDNLQRGKLFIGQEDTRQIPHSKTDGIPALDFNMKNQMKNQPLSGKKDNPSHDKKNNPSLDNFGFETGEVDWGNIYGERGADSTKRNDNSGKKNSAKAGDVDMSDIWSKGVKSSDDDDYSGFDGDGGYMALGPDMDFGGFDEDPSLESQNEPARHKSRNNSVNKPTSQPIRLLDSLYD